jgi:hypothetical protein
MNTKEKAINFVINKLSNIDSVKNAYASEKEMTVHILSGDVSIPATDVVNYLEEYGRENPSQFKHGDKVLFGMLQDEPNAWVCPMTAKVTGVHFYNNKVKYDLEIGIYDEASTRIYNVDSCYVQKYSEEAHRCYSVNKN